MNKISNYDITPKEMFYAELGREISKYAEKNKTTSLQFSRKEFETDRKGSAEDTEYLHQKDQEKFWLQLRVCVCVRVVC